MPAKAIYKQRADPTAANRVGAFLVSSIDKAVN